MKKRLYGAGLCTPVVLCAAVLHNSLLQLLPWLSLKAK